MTSLTITLTSAIFAALPVGALAAPGGWFVAVGVGGAYVIFGRK